MGGPTTFQTAYASDAAIANKREGLVEVMAAYGALYDYLMTPEARDAFFAARKSAQKKKFDEASAQAVWDFNQTKRPYSLRHCQAAASGICHVGLRLKGEAIILAKFCQGGYGLSHGHNEHFPTGQS